MSRAGSDWLIITNGLINSQPTFNRMAKLTATALNTKAVNQEKMAAAEAKRQRKQIKRLGVTL